MSDRDYVVGIFILNDPENKRVTVISKSVEHKDYPPIKGIIRADILEII
jgi:hypothetical protein